MSPYRTSAPVADDATTIPWWQVAWFRVARENAAQHWQWARRAIGGRWSPQRMEGSSAHGDEMVDVLDSWTEAAKLGFGTSHRNRNIVADAIYDRDHGRLVWVRVSECPGALDRFNVAGICDIRGVCHTKHCYCEVYP